MTKPIIPSDLKPGDRLWYSKTEAAVVGDDASWVSYRPGTPASIHAWDKSRGVRYYESGVEIDGDTPPIIRIERIASAKPKKPKGDRDAKLISDILISLDERGASSDGFHLYDFHAKMGIKTCKRRLRAIARRLEGGK